MFNRSILLMAGFLCSLNAIADPNGPDSAKLANIMALQQATIQDLKARLEKIEKDIRTGDIHCPQFQQIANGADGQWHDLAIKFDQVTATYLNAHQGYQITADYAARGVHSLGNWTALNTFSGKTVIVGDSAVHEGGPGLELRWAGPTEGTPEVYKFKLQIRTPTRRVDNTSGEVPSIAVCIQPLPAVLGINRNYY